MNADGAVAGIGSDIRGNNMFAYCFNNPVNMSDPSGHWPKWIKSAVNAVVNAVKKAVTSVVGTVKKAASSIANTVKQSTISSELKPLTEDQKVLVATIAAEATVTAQGNPVSDAGRQAMANVAINRVGSREWSNYTTVAEVCQNTGFDGYGNDDYMACMAYLDARDGSNASYETINWDVESAYNSDITGGGQLYYTPAAMNPPGSSPNWGFGALTEVTILGVDPYYEGRFYKYK